MRYYNIEGKQYPSVTTVLGATSDQSALDKWRVRLGQQAAYNHYQTQVALIGGAAQPMSEKEAIALGVIEGNRISKHACDRGTILHKLCENYLLADGDVSRVELASLPDIFANDTKKEWTQYSEASHLEALSMWQWIQSVLQHVTSVVCTEQTVHHDGLIYAGTLDALGTFNGVEHTLIDFKTSGRPKSQKWIQDYFIQVAAYSGAAYNRFGLRINQAAIIIALERSYPQVFLIDRETLLQYWHLWVARLTKFHSIYG